MYGTVRGAALLAQASDDSARTLRERVTSPNGTTAAAVATLDRLGVMDAIGAAIGAARQRAEALGREDGSAPSPSASPSPSAGAEAARPAPPAHRKPGPDA